MGDGTYHHTINYATNYKNQLVEPNKKLGSNTWINFFDFKVLVVVYKERAFAGKRGYEYHNAKNCFNLLKFSVVLWDVLASK